MSNSTKIRKLSRNLNRAWGTPDGSGTTERKFGILIVDDDAHLASTLRYILEAEGYSTAVAHDSRTALTLCREKVFDLAIVDLKLPDELGIKSIEKLTELSPGMDYIIITGYASLDTAV